MHDKLNWSVLFIPGEFLCLSYYHVSLLYTRGDKQEEKLLYCK